MILAAWNVGWIRQCKCDIYTFFFNKKHLPREAWLKINFLKRAPEKRNVGAYIGLSARVILDAMTHAGRGRWVWWRRCGRCGAGAIGRSRRRRRRRAATAGGRTSDRGRVHWRPPGARFCAARASPGRAAAGRRSASSTTRTWSPRRCSCRSCGCCCCCCCCCCWWWWCCCCC